MDAPPHAGAPVDERAPAEERAALVLSLLAGVGVVCVLFHVDYFPTLDGPHHLFSGHLENHFDDPGAGWPAWLSRAHPLTAMGFHVVFSACERFLAWRTAFRVTLAVIALAWGLGYLALVRALSPRRAALGLLGFATSISWAVHMGFFALAMSLAMGFAILALAVTPGAWPWTPRRRAVLAVLLLVQAVAHGFGAALTGVVLLMIAATATRDAPLRARAREIALLALMGLPALLIASTATGGPSGTTAWLSIVDYLTVLPRTFLPGPLWRAWPPLLLGLGGVVLAAARRRTASPVEIAIAGAAALHLVMALAAPVDLSTWQLFSPRFLPFGCLLGAAVLPVERLGVRGRVAVLAGLSVFTAASLLWAARAVAALRAGEDEGLAGLSAPIHRTGPRMEVALDAFSAQAGAVHREIPYYAPLHYLGSLYAIEQGGIPPFAFLTNPHLHPFVLSPEGKAHYPGVYSTSTLLDPRIQTDPGVRAEKVTYLAMVGGAFEDVIFLGRPGDGDIFVERGYVADFRREGLFIGHLEGCPVTVRVVTPAEARARVFLQYSAEPLAGALQRSELPPVEDAPGPERVREVRLLPPLCGPMWLRVSLDRDGSGGPSKGDAFCEGADPTGRLRLSPHDRAGQMVVCKIAP